MPSQTAEVISGIFGHGTSQLTSVIVDTYNAEMRDKDGFIGDRASRRAFRSIIEDWRSRLRKSGADPIGHKDEDISKKDLEHLLIEGKPRPAVLFWAQLKSLLRNSRLSFDVFCALRMARYAAHCDWWRILC